MMVALSFPAPVDLSDDDWDVLWPVPDPAVDSTDKSEPTGDDGPGTTDPEVV